MRSHSFTVNVPVHRGPIPLYLHPEIGDRHWTEPKEFNSTSIDIPDLSGKTTPIMSFDRFRLGDGPPLPLRRWGARLLGPLHVWMFPLVARDDIAQLIEHALRRRILSANTLADLVICDGAIYREIPEPAWVVKLCEWDKVQARIETRPPTRTTPSAEPFVLFRADREREARRFAQRLAAEVPSLKRRDVWSDGFTVELPGMLAFDDFGETLTRQGPSLVRSIHLALPSLPRGGIEHWLNLRTSVACGEMRSVHDAVRRIGEIALSAAAPETKEMRKLLRRVVIVCAMLTIRGEFEASAKEESFFDGGFTDAACA
jgi:hypothetical protein